MRSACDRYMVLESDLCVPTTATLTSGPGFRRPPQGQQQGFEGQVNAETRLEDVLRLSAHVLVDPLRLSAHALREAV